MRNTCDFSTVYPVYATTETTMELSDFVNGARNACWFSGYAWGVHNGYFLLRQFADEKKAIRIRIPDMFRPPVDNTAVEVKCHVFAQKGEIELHFVRLKRASVTAIPKRHAWLDPLRKRGKDYNPFASMPEIREEIRQSLEMDDALVDSVIRQAQAGNVRGKSQGFVNKLILSGFIGLKGFMQPKGANEEGHLRLMLQQHANPERAVPIRIYGVDARYGGQLGAAMPVTVVAEARSEVNENGHSTIHLRTDGRHVSPGGSQDFEHHTFPAWWREMLSNIHAKLVEEKSQKRDDSGEDHANVTPVANGKGPAPTAASVTNADDLEQLMREQTPNPQGASA